MPAAIERLNDLFGLFEDRLYYETLFVKFLYMSGNEGIIRNAFFYFILV